MGLISMRKIRCSELGRYLACPGFRDLPNLVQPEQDYAAKGTNLHTQLENIMIEGLEPIEEFAGYTNYYGDLKKAGWTVELEIYRENDLLKGTADFVAHKGDMLIIADLKTGFIDVSPDSAQLKAYALLNLRPETTKIACKIFQKGEWKVAKYTKADIESLEVEILNAAPKLALGDHCMFCSRVCPLQQKAIKEVFNTTFSLATLSLHKDAIYKYINKAKKSITEVPEGFTIIKKSSSRRTTSLTDIPTRLLVDKVKIGVADLEGHLKKGEMTQEEFDACVMTTITEREILVPKEEELEEPTITLGEEF